ncbi:MAG: transposase [Nitrospira sp.]|nr:transposase [Nitrospira sp.]
MLRLRDDQWERIRDQFPEEHVPDTRPGRKPIPTRAVLDTVLWILNTGAQWHLLPQCYPNYKTVHRRFQQGCQRAVLREVLTQLANTLRDEGALDERESFIDATFAAANHHEITLVQLSFDFYMLEAKPEHLIGDRAYDSDGLDADLHHDGVNLIAPHRSTRKLKTQDGRHLRRYQRRWLVERFFAWLQWKRRLLIRWEYYAANFLGFVQLACITMLLKRF